MRGPQLDHWVDRPEVEARTNDVCSRPVLISRQLTPHPHPQHVLGTWVGSPQNTASTIRLPTNNPARRSGGGHREPQLNTAHHGRTTTVTYPPRTPAHGRHAPAAHGVGHQSYGGHSVGETPGPIPNPEAKTRSADGTAPGRVWESRTPPDHTTRVEPPHHTVRGLPAFNTPVLVVSPPTTAYGRGPGPGDDEEEPCDGAG